MKGFYEHFFSSLCFVRKIDTLAKNRVFSFLLSVALHLLCVLLLWRGIFHFSSSLQKESPPPPEVIFDLSPSITSPTPSTIRTAAEQPSEKPPEHPVFESHENTEASSELPPSGLAPLPSQKGREGETVELKTSEDLGRMTPDSQVTAQTASAPPLAVAPPSPSTTSSSTSLTEKTSSDLPIKGTLSSAAKNKSEASGASPSVIHGAISNRGKSSVAAEATPLGRYKKNLADTISSHWYYAIDQRMELLSFGTATVIFYVTQNGKVEELRVISNSSNQTFADCCRESITEAKLPSIPPEIAHTLDHGRLEIEYRFTIYP